MKTLCPPLLLALLCFCLCTTRGAENPALKPLLPDDADAAWTEVSKVHEALRPPPEWRAHAPAEKEVSEFALKVRQSAWDYANKAREFIVRFPTNENLGDARITVIHALVHAVAAGDSTAEKEIERFRDSVLADQTIAEDDRVGVSLFAGNVPFMKKAGMRLFTAGLQSMDSEFEAHSIQVIRDTLKQFPTNSMLYTLLVAEAQRAPAPRQRELAREIKEAPGAPAGARSLAEHLLKGTKPFELGKPLDIRFTAFDGGVVDLAKLKGKVVLIEFWSTTCGPCIAEMPSLKAAYAKFHPRGFEIVAINLDDRASALRKFIDEKKLPWPQYFDGKGWENQFAVRYGIFAIPTLWLVDKEGNLVETEARGMLDDRIEALLSGRR